MSNDLTIQRTAEAVESPLVINSILESGVRNAPEQEIVYADQRRMSYRDLEERVNRLAGVLEVLLQLLRCRVLCEMRVAKGRA